jgi:pimeloyl-ACP methyl ester carboxylesterase
MGITAADSLSGNWVGTIMIGEQQLPIRAHFAVENTSSSISLPTEGLYSAEISDFKAEKDAVDFSVKTQGGLLGFQGNLRNREISGTINFAGASGTFRLVLMVLVDPPKYFGIYQFEDNRRIYIRTWDELGEDQLTYLDDSGKVGPLYATSDTEFFSGPGIWLPQPETIRVSFTTGSSGVNGLVWKAENQPSKTARKVAWFREEQITFPSGRLQLTGSIVIPSGQGPHPAIVLIHGSGPVTRDFLGPIAYWFASHGVAAVSYDKRGIGRSQGNWLEANFNDLADDALSAIAFLKSRKDIDPGRIGLLGASQGGWIVPLAASRSKDVAFAVLVSAPAVTPAEQDVLSVEQEMRVAGASEQEVQQTLKKEQTDLDSLRSEDAAKEFSDQVAKLKAGKDQSLLRKNGPDNPLFLLFFRNILDFDPLPYLQKTQCPVLAFYGELDRGVPVEGNKEKLESALKRGGNTNVKVVVLPKADHVLLECRTGSRKEFPYLNRFAPEFFPVLDEWLANTVVHK